MRYPRNHYLNRKLFEEINQRFDQLHANSERLWGKMTAGQMAWHTCQYPLDLAIKNKDYGKKGNPFIKLFFKKSLYNDKPWREKSARSEVLSS